MADWCLKITLDAWFFYRTERRGGEEVKSKDHLSCTIRGYLFFFFSFLQPFTGGESQIVSLWAEKSHFHLTFRQRGRVPWPKQWPAAVKETHPAWSQNWLLPATVPLICTSPVWGQCPVLFHPESPQGAPALQGWLLSPDGYSILCLLMWQVTFLIYARYLLEISISPYCSLKDILLL